jgi:hypothetical protein
MLKKYGMNTENMGLMKLSRYTATVLLAVLLALLVFGTQMPGAWRDETFHIAHLPGQLADVAHFVLFAGLAALDDWLADAVGICLGLWVARGAWIAASLALLVMTGDIRHCERSARSMGGCCCMTPARGNNQFLKELAHPLGDPDELVFSPRPDCSRRVANAGTQKVHRRERPRLPHAVRVGQWGGRARCLWSNSGWQVGGPAGD